MAKSHLTRRWQEIIANAILFSFLLVRSRYELAQTESIQSIEKWSDASVTFVPRQTGFRKKAQLAVYFPIRQVFAGIWRLQRWRVVCMNCHNVDDCHCPFDWLHYRPGRVSLPERKASNERKSAGIEVDGMSENKKSKKQLCLGRQPLIDESVVLLRRGVTIGGRCRRRRLFEIMIWSSCEVISWRLNYRFHYLHFKWCQRTLNTTTWRRRFGAIVE